MARWCWVNFQCWDVLLIWIRVGQGPTALVGGADGDCLDIVMQPEGRTYSNRFVRPSLRHNFVRSISLKVLKVI